MQTAPALRGVSVDDNDERKLLREQLAAGAMQQLNLPPALEAAFLAHRQQAAIEHIRANWYLIFPLIAIGGLLPVLLGLVPPRLQALVFVAIAAFTLLCVLVLVAVFLEVSHASLRVLLGTTVTTVVLLLLLSTAFVLRGEPLYPVLVSLLALCTVGVFELSTLTFRYVLVCVLLADTIFVVLVLLLGLPIEWQVLIVSAVGAGMTGLLVGFSGEIRDRKVFLQSQALALEMRVADAMAKELEQLSRTDPLTGLKNRRYFEETLAREWSACRRDASPIGLLFIDVDHFKNYNDRYGHPAGDACLVQVGRALSSRLSRVSDMVARYGGEEFVVVLSRADGAELARMAEQVLLAVDALGIRHEASTCGDNVTVSIGAAVVVPGAAMEAGELLKRADAALYEAKRAGRHRIIFSTTQAGVGGEGQASAAKANPDSF